MDSGRSVSGTLSTHVLDATTGVPARGIVVRLTSADDTEIAAAETDADGRIGAVTSGPLVPGRYRLTFETADYFRERGQHAFFPEVVITFELSADGHHHVPVLLAPYAYSTYRGS